MPGSPGEQGRGEAPRLGRDAVTSRPRAGPPAPVPGLGTERAAAPVLAAAVAAFSHAWRGAGCLQVPGGARRRRRQHRDAAA